jgi:hypothetical protein
MQNVAEGPTKYRNFHIIAYSFGTIVSLDTLFPFNGEPSLVIRQKLRTLVTIGSPFDFIRTYWPDYFNGRNCTPDLPAKWLNIYSKADIMGSNFRDDDNPDDAMVPVNQPAKKPKDKDPEGRPPGNGGAGISQSTECSKLPKNRLYQEGLYGKTLPIIGWLSLTGMRVHGMYWNDDDKNEANCFSIVVQEMCEDLNLDCKKIGP